jgi:hypothetical protein
MLCSKEDDFVETENDTDESSPHGSPYAESADSSSANDRQ